METPANPRLPLVLLAFAAVYVIWGSTYLGIRFAVETIPPYLMAALRFLTAGIIMLAWAWTKGISRPTASHLRSAAIIGALMLGSNGLLSWAEQFVPSGIAALLVATVPLWIVVLDAAQTRSGLPRPRVIAGLLVGLLAIALLVGPAELGAGAVDLKLAALLLLAAFGWALGSVYSRSAPQSESTILNVGMQMIFGSMLLFAIALTSGERLVIEAVSARSVWALVYLATAGGVVSYAAYLWLLQHIAASKVATYAFVNPVVAVILGWLFAGEVINARVIAASATVVISVALIVSAREK